MIEQIGRYRIAGELGRGAMGVVYRAEDPAIGRTVAIKTIRLSDVTDAQEREHLRERLLREAQSAGILSHPGIVTIYDVAEKDGMAYIFMEFVNGPTLERLISTGHLPGPTALLEVFRQTAAALDYAHKRGIVHRDVKPANIMMQEDGAAKVTDFGVARFTSSQTMTQAGSLTGTPSYMSPEQIQGHPVDGRADQFALAVVAYEILTGEKPFVADSLPALVYRIVREEPASAHRINSKLTPAVDTILRKALSKDPEQRYSTCTDFIRALTAALVSAKGWRPLSPGSAQSLPTVTAPAPEPVEASPVAWRPRERDPEPEGSLKKGLLIGLGVGVLVLLAVVGLPHLSRESGAPPQAAPKPPPVQTSAVQETKPSPLPAEPVPDTAAGTPTPEQPEAAQEPPAPPPGVQRQGQVQIQTDPPGAMIILDNNPAGACTTPCSLAVSSGRHTFSATRNGYRVALGIFEVPRDTEVRLRLEEVSGTLLVRTDPDGATIFVDGRPHGKKTPAVLTVPAGRRKITLMKEGYPSQEDEILVRDGATVNYEYTWGR